MMVFYPCAKTAPTVRLCHPVVKQNQDNHLNHYLFVADLIKCGSCFWEPFYLEIFMNETKNVSRLFMCIGIVFVTCLLLSNLVAGKMWAVTDSITLPAAVILFPMTYIIGDVFTEVYGFRKARTIYLITIALPHPGYWEGQEAYSTVLGTTPRVALASFAGYLFGEFSNSIILSRLKVITKGKNLWIRTILSTVIGEGLDSVIFIMISFWGTMDNSVVLQMILFQYLFKVSYEVLFTPVTYLVVKLVKRAEGIDVYDAGIKYNLIKG